MVSMMVAVLPLATLFPTTAGADDFSERDRFYALLSAPMTSIVDGKSFRNGVTGIAKQAELNIWIDRRVDPTSPVTAGPVGPTVFAAIGKLAARRDCVLMPVANVLLVGRQDWVDRTASSILSLKISGKQELADIVWEDLTTPAEAIARAAGGAVEVEPVLPHDLWPATTWKQVDRRVAVTLVLAQFDRLPQSTTALGNLRSTPATKGSFSRRYWLGKANSIIRDVMQEQDRKSKFGTQRGWLEATGSIAAHRAAVTKVFDNMTKVAAPDPRKDTFTLKKMSTTAENALIQFARTAGRTCLIKADAVAACKQIVSIEGQDITLEQLTAVVAKQVGVDVQWHDDRIVVSRQPR
jgi:hypothetical protein